MIDTWILSMCRCGHREACINQVAVDVMDGLLVCITHDVEDKQLQGISEEIESLYSWETLSKTFRFSRVDLDTNHIF